MNVKEMFAKAKVLNSWQYNKKELYRGYTDKILYINVGDSQVQEKDVPAAMAFACFGIQPHPQQSGMILKTR